MAFMGFGFISLKRVYICAASNVLSAESTIILPPSPSIIIELAMPNPTAVCIFPPGVSYE